MIRKILVIIFSLNYTFATAQNQPRHDLPVNLHQTSAAIVGNEKPAASSGQSTVNLTGARGPGKTLMTSWFDYGSNGGVLGNIVDYGDGTLAIARMAAALPNTEDRGTFWSYFDGAGNWSPMAKVERERRGWSSLAALADGRSVVVSHEANEVNVDSVKGAGRWTSSLTGYATLTRAIWPRVVVDGRDNLIVCATVDGVVAGIQNPKEVTISRDGGRTWTRRVLLPPAGSGNPTFVSDDQALASFGDKIAIVAADLGGDIHLWESLNNGMTWNYRNLTGYPRDIPVGTEATRPWENCEALYDHAGNLHIFWESLLATQDVAGTSIEVFHSRKAGIQHWSAASGVKQVVAWQDLPSANLETDAELFAAGAPFNQINAENTLVAQPQAGIDLEGNLYLLFAAYRPRDFDVDQTHFTDLYAVGSNDGGAHWGAPVNVTDTPQSEDLWASMAKNIADSLRFVYQSDGNTGNSIQGGGLAPTTILFHGFAKDEIPFTRPGEILLEIPRGLTAHLGRRLEVPILLSLSDTSLIALGAVLKVGSSTGRRILSFAGFTPGRLIPGELFSLNAPAPDSIRLAYVDFGGGPIAQEGELVTLQFDVDPSVRNGEVADFIFSELSASDPQFQNLPIRFLPGKVTVEVRSGSIQGVKWHDFNGNGLRDANEPGVADWEIQALGPDTVSTRTDASGRYAFATLHPGRYRLSEVQRPGWKQTFPPTGSHDAQLAEGAVIQNLNFGNQDTTNVSVEERNETALPKNFELAQNHPNPFNPTTLIKYAVPHKSRVVLEVFNLLGNRVAVLVEEEKAAGYYEVKLDAGQLPGGIYFYRLTAADFVGMKKMVVIK